MKDENRKWLIFAVTSMANLVAPFSINSITLALPILAKEFETTQKTVSWLPLVYSLIPSCTLLILGRTAELYGYKKQLKIGFLFFGAVCLLAPIFSTSIGTLIFFRCLQGIGYAIMISITQAIVSLSFNASERGKAIGVHSVFVSVGLAAGPTIGGFLLRYFSWRAIFYFNVPFCLLGYVVANVILPDNFDNTQRGKKMDWIGALLLAFSIGAITIGLNFSDTWGILSIRFLGSLFIGAIGLFVLIKYENNAESPLIAMDLFRNRTFSTANVVSMLSYIVQQLTVYLTPFYLINIIMQPSDRSGLIMLASPAAMMIIAPFGGRLADKKGTKLPAGLGLSLICISCFILSQLNENSSAVIAITTLALMGAGNGLSMSSINTAILNSADNAHAGVASGMLATMRNLGQTLGVVCGSVIMASRLLIYNAALDENHAYLSAQRDAFYFGVIVLIIAILLVFSLPKSKRATDIV